MERFSFGLSTLTANVEGAVNEVKNISNSPLECFFFKQAKPV